MIEVTRLNGQHLVLNGDQIERIEANPDTLISLSSGRKLIVLESVDELIEKLIAYRRRLLLSPEIVAVEREYEQEALPILV